ATSPVSPPHSLMRLEQHDTQTPTVPSYHMQPARIAERISDDAQVWSALVTGTRDYVRKNGFHSVVLGMSCGIDSAVVAGRAAGRVGGGQPARRTPPRQHPAPTSQCGAPGLAHPPPA